MRDGRVYRGTHFTEAIWDHLIHSVSPLLVKRIFFSLRRRDSQGPGHSTTDPETVSSLRFATMNQPDTATRALATSAIDDIGGSASQFGFIHDDAQYWDEDVDERIHERDVENGDVRR